MSVQSIFNTNSVKTLLDVVGVPGMAFMMPDYQRPYRWSEENIERLITDLIDGLRRSGSGEAETLFLGTLIVVQVQNTDLTTYISNLTKYAAPAGMYYVVDGQQRLSTFAILAIVLHREIKSLLDKIDAQFYAAPEYESYRSLKKFIESEILSKLEEFYSIRFSGSSDPKQKPLILRKSQEFWVKSGSSVYVSPVARYIADYIDTGTETDYSELDEKYQQIQKNQKEILSKLQDSLLITNSLQYDTIQKESKTLVSVSKSIFPLNYGSEMSFLLNEDILEINVHCEQLLKYCLVTIFLANHCCVNYLEPKTHQWAIEVFQSLNSTGVPLSALEVFKAYVHQHAEFIQLHGDLVKDVFDTVEEQMISDNNNSAQYKTDVFLTAFALGFNGEKLGTRYTQQDKYLQKTLREYSAPHLQGSATNLSSGSSTLMFQYMRHLSKYMHFLSNPDSSFAGSARSDVQFAYVNLLFLKAMNFSTTYPLLAYFYKDNDLCNMDFINACDSTAAFYALWRSARSSSKLDNVARELMSQGLFIDDGSKVKMSWKEQEQRVSIQQYKQALKNVLIREDIWDKSKWMSNAKNYLTYQNSAVLCRFILFLSNHNTVEDADNPGLMLRGSQGTHDFFNSHRWLGDNHSTVEHIAPQRRTSNDSTWSEDVYSGTQGNITHTIGNLTLLPKAMNSIVGNLSWSYKHKFYAHLASPTTEGKKELLRLEGDQSIKYSKAAKNILESTDQYFHYLKPIVLLSSDDGSWRQEIIEKRTEFICSLAYDRLTKWLQD
jgi:uncharacterized protein with ParB-like and HNH nuclease domain